ncbi:hypothetical protein L211DRAFT_305288 [Terfezia boudieri ATCC MYA-4762]|uniref:Structure-specific endonuclease subunit SLX4 n=1 Tax=Terfezia boudieri ATCC MYA-4762 TaxID=1051890 RepID=A0A3N4LNG2_9PEZI|nr:hypothetical protein L211DRAFT_305288 [Terfezia boudieri ATCC MYA-4762]
MYCLFTSARAAVSLIQRVSPTAYTSIGRLTPISQIYRGIWQRQYCELALATKTELSRMEPSMVIVLSSSPPPTATSQDVPRSNKGANKIAASGRGLCTPTKDHRDIWKIPSSSPLPSPGALLRGLLESKARRRGQSKIGKSFKTASELLETEEQKRALLFGLDNNKHAEEYATIIPEETTTRAKFVVAKKSAPAKTVAKSENKVKRAATVSSHFLKKSKTSNVGKSSKSLPPVERTNSSDQNKTVSLLADVMKQTQEMERDAEAGLDEVPVLPVPARRRDWTPVKNTVPEVEILSSPIVWRTEYEADLGEAEALDFTAETDESTLSKRSFEDKIGLFKFSSNSTSGPSMGTTSARSLGSTLGTTKRWIQMLEKPQSTRSISSISGPAKTSERKSRKKAEIITDLAAAQYHTEKEDNEQPPSAIDFLTKWSSEATPNDTNLPAKKRKRQTKSKDTTGEKKVRNRKGGRKASKEEVDEPIKLLSPQSAIIRTNEQQIIFGTFSQLTDGKVNEQPDTEVSGQQKSSSSFNHRVSSDSQFDGPAKVRSPQMYNNSLGEEDFRTEVYGSERTRAENALKRKGLWEAASWNDELADIDFVDLSKTLNIDKKELEMSLKKSRRENGQGRKSGSVTPDSVKKSATPPMKKRKKDLLKFSAEVSKSAPVADRSDIGAPDIVSGKGKKSKGKPIELTGSQQSKKKRKGKGPTSPAMSKKKKRAKSSKSRSPSVSMKWPSASPHDDETNIGLHRYISNAIKAEYRSTNDIVNSWHYKILTYEPIILEDLTVWLNTVGFGNVGMDDEVSPSVVKDWAEARSVIHVWRETHRGRDRKRF